MKTVNLRIEGMTCEHCAQTIRKALESAVPAAEIEISFPQHRATISLDADLRTQELVNVVTGAGYRASVIEADPSRQEAKRTGSPEQKHLLIIGAGSGAFAAAIRAAELGGRVTLVERSTIGGTCVNVGCVPSKTLIKAAETFYSRRHQPFAGLPGANGSVDLAALVGQKRQLVAQLREEKYRKVLAAYESVEYLEGEAQFVDSGTVGVQLRKGGRREIQADRTVIATGATPWVPPIAGLKGIPYWTNVEALEAEELPERLIVIGGSAVGVELAQMFSRLGSRVTVVEMLPTLVPNEDPELGVALARYFEQEGIEVYTNARVSSAFYDRREGYRVEVEIDEQKMMLNADQLLMATGRRANTGALNLKAAGVETDEKGFILVDEYLRTSQPYIYAVGDCSHLPQFVYVAAKAGTLAAENALHGNHRKLDLSSMPAVTFTDPQVASVGLTEQKAKERGLAVESRVLPLDHVPRALVNRDTRGLIKIVSRENDQRILGVHVLSPAAGEVIQTAVLAVKLDLTVAELADTLFPYLTEVEGLRLAAQTFQKNVAELSCCAG